MLAENYYSAIRVIVLALKSVRAPWAIIGSANMALHGMDVVPNDLDVSTNLNSLHVITEALAKYKNGEPEIKQPLVAGFREYTEQSFLIEGVDVTFCGEYEDDVYFHTFVDGEIEELNVGGVCAPVFSLLAEMRSYRMLGREKKAKMIEEFLDRSVNVGGKRV